MACVAGILGGVAIDVRELPPEVARAVQRARAEMPPLVGPSKVPKPWGPEAAAWAERIIASGELKKALDQVATDDPEIAD